MRSHETETSLHQVMLRKCHLLLPPNPSQFVRGGMRANFTPAQKTEQLEQVLSRSRSPIFDKQTKRFHALTDKQTLFSAQICLDQTNKQT